MTLRTRFRTAFANKRATSLPGVGETEYRSWDTIFIESQNLSSYNYFIGGVISMCISIPVDIINDQWSIPQSDPLVPQLKDPHCVSFSDGICCSLVSSDSE